ncbi:hypothetical protein B551_0213990 [Cupriavidus sp. HPC(L)]|uniref:Fic family protein n=1 Tax=Cupriavidus sp. HPC(L) TaxID=1217418 RepID=UPI0003BEA79B|nr:Fic family protein [Cupriavidus sp. HPC(L)]ESJ12529.1 hypothetical protein B551_0213990 [Cupriavidus sp. HPC(L)]
MALTSLGYMALVQKFDLRVPPLRSTYELADKTGVLTRHTGPDGTTRVIYPRNRYRGGDSIVDHLLFALKKEQLDLTVLAALFEHPEAIAAVQEWLRAAPTSRYARLSGFYAKWLAGAQFDYNVPSGAPRIPALDERAYITGPVKNDTQFGVQNNHLGPPAFCPVVRRTDELAAWIASDLPDKVAAAIERLEPEVLARAVDYLYLAETRSTYSIEREVPDNQRVAKFRRLLQFAGAPGPLTEDQLCEWQNEIISGPRSEYSYRDRQNWLSRGGRMRNMADYIPPNPEQLDAMMEGISQVASLIQTGTVHPIVVAACASFGFVFAHPFYDGNGRLHRFLIHHLLRQAGVTPEGVVLPISARMLKEIDTYAGLLKAYSAPRTALLNYVLDADSDTILIKSPQPYWLYASFDATALCEFVFRCIEQCVEHDLAQEIQYLRAYDASLERIEGWLDLPQSRLSNLIDLIVQNHGELSKRKRKLFEDLTHDEVERIESIVRDEFDEYLNTFGQSG